MKEWTVRLHVSEDTSDSDGPGQVVRLAVLEIRVMASREADAVCGAIERAHRIVGHNRGISVDTVAVR
jgi:hypothetical protein